MNKLHWRNWLILDTISVFVTYDLHLLDPDIEKSKWVWSGNITITNCRQICGILRKSHRTIMRHQEDKQSKATSSLFPIEMIAKLELTKSKAQQNTEQIKG